jgi:hypothetical protein
MNKLPVFLIASIIVVMVAPAAHADVGQQFCGYVRDQANPPTQGCFTIEPTDTLKETFVTTPASGYLNPATGKLGNSPTTAGCASYPPSIPYTCQPASYYFVTRTYTRRHAYNALVWRVMSITHYSPDGVSVAPVNLQSASAADDSRVNVPDCPRLYEGVYGGGYPGLLTDAALLLSVCGITLPAKPEVAQPVTTTTAPLRRCAAFKVGKKRVAVTSRGVACAPARNLLARFVKRGVEPAGYTCVKIRLGRQVAAKCAKSKGKARAAARPIVVEGRWRV